MARETELAITTSKDTLRFDVISVKMAMFMMDSGRRESKQGLASLNSKFFCNQNLSADGASY